ncbi:MAG: ribonuclease Z [Rikenellaceae bacterium]
MTFSITILGTSSALPTVNKNPSAHALNVHEQIFLLDCGEGTQQQLVRAGISPMQVNAVFITHLHGDHVYGIWGLISTLGLLGRRTPLTIYAPRPFDEILENHIKYFDNNLPFKVIWEEVKTREHNKIFENKVMEVWTVPLRHRVPCAGYLIKEKTPSKNILKHMIERYKLSLAQIVKAKNGEDITLDDGSVIPNSELTYTPYNGRSYAYLSDTEYSAKAVEIVKGVDVLYHEATYMNVDKARAKQTGHTTTAQAAKAAQTAGAKRLIIGHLSSRYRGDLSDYLKEAQEVFENTNLAREGETITIPIEKLGPHYE